MAGLVTQAQRAAAISVVGFGAAALVAYYAANYTLDTTVTTFTLTDAVDVTSGSGVATCEIGLTSTDPILDAGCTIESPTGRTLSHQSTNFTGTTTNGTWTVDIPIPQNEEQATWFIQRVFARDTAGPTEKLSLTGAEMVAYADILGGTGGGGEVIQADIEIAITSTTGDTVGPVISATGLTPSSIYQVFGGTLSCENTLTDANGIKDTGCSTSEVTCSSTALSGGVWKCDLPILPGAAAGSTPVTAFARDNIGNRSRYVDNGTFTVATAGLTYSYAQSLQTLDAGLPLGLDTDASGNAWYIGEFSRTIVKIANADLAVTRVTVPINGNLYTSGGTPTTQTILAEKLVVASDGMVWFTQGGCHLCGATDISHSRVGRYNPTLASFQMYNLPGLRNEATGLFVDESRGAGNSWIWVLEAGFESTTAVEAAPHSGTIIAFRPDLAAWDNAMTLGGWSGLDAELCDGTGGNTTPDDGCFQRFQLPVTATSVGARWPSHVVADTNGDIWFANFWGTSIARLVPSTEVVTIYPAHEPRSAFGAGSGTWDIAISPDGSRVVFSEYGDGDIGSFDWSRRDDSACLSRDAGGKNPCITEIAVVDPTWKNTHDIAYDGCGSLWFNTGIERGPPAGTEYSTLGFIRPDWSGAVLLEPTDFTPDPNPDADVSYHGIAFDSTNGNIWSAQGPTTNAAKVGLGRWVPVSADCTP